ncbi:cytidine deaminase [Hugenholtzia roseola]|uniref:cytidine deaminase n=1 Tax=Hugenholtzia roseola TaxID=1002 RepID=UPI0003F8EB5F|nr:cytidine deaminase [Hugenholtzia roseola]
MPDIKTIVSLFEVYERENDLKAADLALLQAARTASATAYAPYSQFWVGAAIRYSTPEKGLDLTKSQIFIGSNQENAAYPSGLCAERTAIFALSAQQPQNHIWAVAIAARKSGTEVFLPISPCGACRQSLLEYEKKQGQPIRLIMETEGGQILIAPSIASLLPVQFSAESLH